jgi:hypothetical protein
MVETKTETKKFTKYKSLASESNSCKYKLKRKYLR